MQSSQSQSIAFYDYTLAFRELRKITVQAMSPSAASKYATIQERVVIVYLAGLLRKPEEFMDNLW